MPSKTSAPNPATTTTPTPAVCHAGVRFDRERGQWGILDKDLKVVRTFERGVILNATMEGKQVRTGMGCGAHTDVIGVAYGEVHEGSYGGSEIPKTGFRNLDFRGGVFVDGDDNRIESASVIRLMPGRKALFRP